ncbi:MAG: histidine phosphotransferase ChpT, partial [Paracoccaceae bacterium]
GPDHGATLTLFQPLSRIKDRCQGYSGAVYNDFSLITKVNGDFAGNVGLHLPYSPFGTFWVAHQHTGCKNGIKVGHGRPKFRSGILQQTNANLATLIGSRICHDLISPIGAINNGLELLGLTGGVQGPEMDLIADSVEHAEARIRFFRVAYGASGDQMMGQPEVVSILDDVGRGRRLATQWEPTAAQSRADVRLAFLALQCCESALPYGGTVTFMVEDSVWTIVGTAEKLKFDADLWAGLSGTASQAEITPALVQFALLPVIATELKRKIKVVQSETQITLRF